MTNKQSILDAVKQAVQSVDADAQVILFGSRARGDYHDESDWDFLILVDKEEKDFDFKNKVRDSLYNLELRIGVVISSIIRNRKFWEDISITPLYKEVEKDGVVI